MTTLSPKDARQIAKEAYVYGFPIVDNYRVNHSYFVDRASPEFKAPWNELHNTARVFTPDDKAIQTPNSDTLYSLLGTDLRAEPLVLTIPPIERNRYFSVQLIDAYTHNFAYIGTRTTGNGGGHYLLAGPGWKGEAPERIAATFRSETELGWAFYRTQLFDPSDIDGVKAVQAGLRVETLSHFLGQPPRPAAPEIDFVPPLTVEEQRTSLAFFNVLAFALGFCPPHPSEVALRARFARLGIAGGKVFDPARLSPEILQAVKDGMADAWAEFAAFKARDIDTGKRGSADVFGTREYLQNNYLYRMAGAVLGIYGNSKEEAIYPIYFVDAAGDGLDGSRKTYALRFPPGALPPAGAFWSLTLYALPSRLLHANPLKRYLINSPMLESLERDADGGLTLHVQHASPSAGRESNWLPAPAGPFFLVLRLYLPKEEATSGAWKRPEPEGTPIAGGAALVPVTPESYIRAETDRTFRNVVGLAGGVNQFHHIRRPTPLDAQTVIRMNLDTLYSGVVVDTSKGATITLPRVPNGRFISAQVIDNDHYCPAVFYEAGPHPIQSDTKYVLVNVRIQVFDPRDRAEVALVNALQDQISVSAGSADPLPPPRWEPESLQALTSQYEKESKAFISWKGLMGPRGKVDEARRHIAAAAAWGLNPEEDATYLVYAGEHDPGKGYTATYRVPENGAFWSLTVYGDDGYMKSENNVLNSSNAKLDADGTFTVFFGSKALCGDVPNRLDVTPGWNFLLRVYRPGPSVLDGSYVLPAATAVGSPARAASASLHHPVS